MPITPELRKTIFNTLLQNLETLCPPLVLTKDVAALTCELIGNTPVPYGYDKKIIPGMYFASIAQRKDSVAFYFFPAYMHPELSETAPTLFKCLKGKTCFHFKKESDIDEKEFIALMKKGVQAWTKSGYIK